MHEWGWPNFSHRAYLVIGADWSWFLILNSGPTSLTREPFDGFLNSKSLPKHYTPPKSDSDAEAGQSFPYLNVRPFQSTDSFSAEGTDPSNFVKDGKNEVSLQ